MKPIRMLAAVATSLCVAAPVFAASLTLTDISANWSTSTPTVDGLGTNEIRWGDPADNNRSGYNFASSGTPFSVQDQSEFVIGQFSHENFPVFGAVLRSAGLAVQFTIEGHATPITSTFAFEHLETPNNPPSGVCPNGEDAAVGVNSAGCADRVTATLNLDQSEIFEIDGVTYVLDIFGFQVDGEKFTDFWTQENQSNSADLTGIFRVVGGEPISEVPLPAGGLLLLTGFATLMFGRRRT